MSTERARFNLRVPVDLRTSLEALAKKRGVSVNSLIATAIADFLAQVKKK